MRLICCVGLSWLLLAGCSESRTVGGRLDQSQFRLESAQVVAIAADGRIWRSHVGTDGRFQIALATDATYTLRFANATTDARRFDVFAVLTHTTADGSRHENFRLTPGDAIDLGLVRRAGTFSAALTAASGEDLDGDDGEDDDADTDSDGRRDDAITACDLSGGGDLVAAEAESSLMAEIDSDDDGIDDDEDTDDCDSDSDSDDESDAKDSEDDDADSDSEADLICEDASSMMDGACDAEEGETAPEPSPGAGPDSPDCAGHPSDPGCL